ncbi:MAG: RidA family protein [Stappiaceae bacterium]
MSGRVEERLSELGITLPTPSAPLANYVPYVVTGNLLWISGQLPIGAEGLAFSGKCGSTQTTEDAANAAKLCAINLLAQAKAALGDLEKITRLVKLVGFVSSTPEFLDQPKVINGASDFMVDVLGDRGRHARSAVSAASLPLDASVEIEAVFEFA